VTNDSVKAPALFKRVSLKWERRSLLMSESLVTGSNQNIEILSSAMTPLGYDGSGVIAAVPYVLRTDNPGETVYQNVSCNIDQPNYVKYSAAVVPDMFKNISLSPIEGQTGVQGLNYLIQVAETWAMRDGIATPSAFLPVSAHIVLKLPQHVAVDATAVTGLVCRLLGALCGTNQDLASGLGSILHGITRNFDPLAAVLEPPPGP